MIKRLYVRYLLWCISVRCTIAYYKCIWSEPEDRYDAHKEYWEVHKKNMDTIWRGKEDEI